MPAQNQETCQCVPKSVSTIVSTVRGLNILELSHDVSYGNAFRATAHASYHMTYVQEANFPQFGIPQLHRFVCSP